MHAPTAVAAACTAAAGAMGGAANPAGTPTQQRSLHSPAPEKGKHMTRILRKPAMKNTAPAVGRPMGRDTARLAMSTLPMLAAGGGGGGGGPPLPSAGAPAGGSPPADACSGLGVWESACDDITCMWVQTTPNRPSRVSHGTHLRPQRAERRAGGAAVAGRDGSPCRSLQASGSCCRDAQRCLHAETRCALGGRGP